MKIRHVRRVLKLWAVVCAAALFGQGACAGAKRQPARANGYGAGTSPAGRIEAGTKAEAAAVARQSREGKGAAAAEAVASARPAVARAVERVYPALVRIAVVTVEPEGG